MDAHHKASLLGFILVMLAAAISLIVLHLRSGGGLPGRLQRSIEINFPKSKQNSFLEKFRHRVVLLRFEVGAKSTEFIQREPPIGELGAFPHSKTRKTLTLRLAEEDVQSVTATITVRYRDIILVDTGEAAYAAELLNYVSGESDSMRKILNQSLTAWNSLIGGLFACGLSAYLIFNQMRSLWPAIPILGVTEFTVGLVALASMWLNPGEVVGRGKAIIGIILSVLAVVGTLMWILSAGAKAGS